MSSVQRFKIWYHHGVGGASPVTKGFIDFNRAVYANEADCYWMGHKHTSSIDPGIERMYIDKAMKPFIKKIRGFYTAGYKGGEIHNQVQGGYYVPDFSTERFLNHSSYGAVFMKIIIKHENNEGSRLQHELWTSRNHDKSDAYTV